jgi:hypothetical protein
MSYLCLICAKTVMEQLSNVAEDESALQAFGVAM